MKYLLLVLPWLFSPMLYAQTKAEYANAIEPPLIREESVVPPVTADKRADKFQILQKTSRTLVDFYVPSALFLYNVEPASISRITFVPTDTKFAFKYGGPKKKEGKEERVLNNGWAFIGSGKLSDGARTLFSSDNVSREFSLKLVRTQVLRDKFWVVKGTDSTYSSNQGRWLNINGSIDISKKNVFTGDTIYTAHNNVNAQFLVTYNDLFNTLLNRYKGQRRIFSVGLGYGMFDNYESLDDYTMRQGVVSANGGYLGERSSVVGKRGDFRKLSGVLGVGSIFVPLTSPQALTTLFAGANGTMFGLGSADYTATVNAGFFLSQRTFNDEKTKLTENFSFGLVGVFSQLQKSGETGYIGDHFSVILTTQIPISFR